MPKILVPLRGGKDGQVKFRWLAGRILRQHQGGVEWASCQKKQTAKETKFTVFNAASSFAQVVEAKTVFKGSSSFSKPCSDRSFNE